MVFARRNHQKDKDHGKQIDVSPVQHQSNGNLKGIVDFQHGFALRGHHTVQKTSTSMRIITTVNFRGTKARASSLKNTPHITMLAVERNPHWGTHIDSRCNVSKKGTRQKHGEIKERKQNQRILSVYRYGSPNIHIGELSDFPYLLPLLQTLSSV